MNQVEWKFGLEERIEMPDFLQIALHLFFTNILFPNNEVSGSAHFWLVLPGLTFSEGKLKDHRKFT